MKNDTADEYFYGRKGNVPFYRPSNKK